MIIEIELTTGCDKDEIKKIGSRNYKVRITKHPIKGEANKALIGLLSKKFKKSKSLLKIVAGSKSRHKFIELLEGK